MRLEKDFTVGLRNKLTGVVQLVSGKRRLLARFYNECEKDLTPNQIIVVTVQRTPMTEEAEVSTFSVIPDETIDLDKGYYHGVYVLIQFNQNEIVNRNEEQDDMEADLDEEEMQEIIFDDKRERCWRMVFKDNGGGVDDEKYILYDKRWDVYMNKKLYLVKGGYYVEVSGSDWNNMLWQLVENHVV